MDERCGGGGGGGGGGGKKGVEGRYRIALHYFPFEIKQRKTI